jgi:hypothetical protein
MQCLGEKTTIFAPCHFPSVLAPFMCFMAPYEIKISYIYIY